MNRLQNADSLCRISLQLDSLNHWSYGVLSEVYLNTHRIQDAENILLTGIRNNPKAVELLIALGKIYIFTQRIDDAARQFNKAIEVNPNNSETHFQLGLAYNQLKRYEESAMANRRVIELNPGNFMANFNLACALSMLNKTDEAFQQLEQAIQKGFNNYDNIQNDHDLDHLKDQKDNWNVLMKKYFPDQNKE
ncbi:MAG: tetratricopeptide repeat protein [Saprospiraceae bacterium]|nr:tetratricopeptide repeat protein [Saprospiraceae bacterium]